MPAAATECKPWTLAEMLPRYRKLNNLTIYLSLIIFSVADNHKTHIMKKNLILFALLVFSITTAQVPDWLWAKNIRTFFNNRTDITTVDNNGNSYLIGDFETSTASIGSTTFNNYSDAGYVDAYLIKFDNIGNILWSKQIGSNRNDYISSIDTDNIGNVYISGTFGNTVTLGSTTLTGNPNGCFFAKLDPNGNYIWAKKSDGINESFGIGDIKSNELGDFFIAGSMSSNTLTFGSVSLTHTWDPTVFNLMAFVAKFDTSGNCLWAKKIPAENSSQGIGVGIKSLAPDYNGGVALSGSLTSNSMTFGPFTLTKTAPNVGYSPDMFVAKYNENGNEMWAYSAGNLQHPTDVSGLTVDANNNIFIGGAFTNSIQIGTTLLTAAGSRYFFAKYSPDGSFQWAKTSGFGTNSYTKINSLTTDENNNIYAAGLTFATTVNFSNNITLNFPSGGAVFVTKFNTSGIATWAKDVPGINANNFVFLDCKSENDLIVAGWFEKPTLQLGNTLLTKSRANYDLYIGRLYSELNNTDYDDNAVLIFPNPANDVLHITNLKQYYSYCLYNCRGKCLKQGLISNLHEIETMDVSELQTGIYLIMLTDISGKNVHKKIIIN